MAERRQRAAKGRPPRTRTIDDWRPVIGRLRDRDPDHVTALVAA